jgi:cobalamin synthase
MRKHIGFLSNFIILPFVKAWNLFFQVQLPVNRVYSNYSEVDESHVLYFIPVVGAAIGIIVYFFISLIYFSTGTVVATILCPFAIVIFIEYLNHSIDSSNLVNLLTSKYAFYHKNPTEEHHHQQNHFMFYYVFIGIFIIRILCYGALIYFHRFGWLTLMFILTFAIQGYFAAKGEYQIHREDLLQAGNKPGFKIWIITFILCLIFGSAYLFSMIFAFAVTLFIGYKVKIALIRSNALNGANIGIIGKVMEILILLLGLMYRFNLN